MLQKRYNMLFITGKILRILVSQLKTGANLVVSQFIKIGTPIMSRKRRYIGKKISQKM